MTHSTREIQVWRGSGSGSSPVRRQVTSHALPSPAASTRRTIAATASRAAANRAGGSSSGAPWEGR